MLNFFLPFCRIGTRRFDPEAFQEPANKWFCSELIVAALQSGGYFTDQEARATSPNDLYRLCSYNDVSALRFHSQSMAVHEWACRALQNLTSSSTSAEVKAGEAGVVEALVASMNTWRTCAAVQQRTFAALREITRSGGSIENRLRARGAGAIEAAISVMKASPESAEVQKNTLAFFEGILDRDEDDRIRAVIAGFIETAVAAMRALPRDLTVHSRACAALKSMSVHTAFTDKDLLEQARLRMTKAGTFEVLVAMMRLHEGKASVQSDSCGVIAYILIEQSSGKEEYQNRVAQAGGVGAIVEALKTHPRSADVQFRACQALAKLVDYRPVYQRSAGEAGAVKLVAESLRAHATVANVQESAIIALSNLVNGVSTNQDRANQEGVKELAETASTTHSGNADVVFEARKLIERLAA